MDKKQTVLLLCCAIIITLLIDQCYAWGPLFHQSISSSVLGCLQNSTTVKQCFSKGNNARQYSFILGASSPDAGKRLTMRLHHFEFTTVALEFAQSGKFQSRDAKFDAEAFVLGYGYHLAQDFVGHYAKGYLTPKYNRPLQIAVDSGEYHTHFKKKFITGFPYQKFNDDAVRFLFEAQVYYEQWCREKSGCKPYTAFNATAVQDAVDGLEKIISLESRLVVFNLIWKKECKLFDFCSASTVDEALQRLQESKVMSLNLSSTWMQHALDGKVSAQEMQQTMRDATGKIYAARGGSICTH